MKKTNDSFYHNVKLTGAQIYMLESCLYRHRKELKEGRKENPLMSDFFDSELSILDEITNALNIAVFNNKENNK